MPQSETTSRFSHDTPALPKRILDSLIEYVATVRLFSRNARLFLTGLCLTAINFHIFMLLLNLYLKEFGFGEGDIGMVNSSRSIGMTLMAIPAGLYLSRIRLKPVLVIAVIVFGGLSFGLSTVTGFGEIVMFGVLSGMAFAVFRVSSGPFFMRNSTVKERTHLFSFSFAMWILAGMIGSVGSGQLVVWLSEVAGDTVLGYRYTLYFGIGFSMLSLIPFAMIRSAKPSAEERRLNLSRSQLKTRWPFYAKVFSVNTLVGMGAGLSIPFLNLYFRNRFGLNADTIGVYYFCVMASMLVGTLSGPLIAKKLGLVRTVVLTQLLSIPFLLVLAYTHFLPAAFGAFVIRGGLMNLGVPMFTNLAMELSGNKEHGFVNALLMVAWTSSWMISTALGGEIIERYGFTVSLNVTVVAYVISTIVLFGFFKGVERRNVETPGWHIPDGAKL
ncbi:MFS transporter [candidate division GN15 bacterium]|nr:MFS transporter [candidate division GN15 bacterium]